MFIFALLIGIGLAIALFIAGVANKKIVLAVAGVITGVVFIGLLVIIILANSPLWSM